MNKYKKIIWCYVSPKKKNPDTLYLTKKDINHLFRIYQKYNLESESIDDVKIEYIADRDHLIRYVIKELDILLKIGGTFTLLSTYTSAHAIFIRSKSQIKYEFSVATNGRYYLKKQEKVGHKYFLKYKKECKTLPEGDTIERWSFGIITDGRKNEQVERLVESIIQLDIPYYEIILCGPFCIENFKNHPVIILDDVILDKDIRAPITRKKNKIANKSKYNNLCIMHDRYKFPEDWYKNMKMYGNYFDLLVQPNIGAKGGRIVDWIEYNGMPSKIFFNHTGLLRYSKWSSTWYVPGGFLIIKNNLYKNTLLDYNLFWDELEDVQFSQIGNLKGWFCYIDTNNKVYSFSDRLSEISLNKYLFPNKFKLIFRTMTTLIKQLIVHNFNKKS